MAAKVDLYNSAYSNYESEVYRQIRIETYGQDFGQTSWVTTEESREIPQMLQLDASSSVLEIGCGSGRYALHLANYGFGCECTPEFTMPINSPRRAVWQHEHALSSVTFRKGSVTTMRPLTRCSRMMFCAISQDDSTCCARS